MWRFRRQRSLGSLCLLAALVSGGCRIRSVPADTPAVPTAPSAAQAPAALPPSAPLSVIQARDILAEAVAKSPKQPQPGLELALFDLRVNDPASAEREMLELRRKFPRYARAAYHLGVLYIGQKRLREALPSLRAAAELAPNDVQTLVSVGNVLLSLGAEGEARRYAERALACDPKFPETYLLLARAYDHHGTAQQSIQEAQKYLELSPNQTPGLFMLGRLYASQADGPHAEEWLLKAKEADPKNVEILVTLGRVYYEMLRTTRGAEAVPLFEKALEIDPANWEAHLWLGRAQMGAGQFSDAVRHLQQAVANAPQPGPLYYDLGQALLKSGQSAEGQKMLATYQSYREYTNGVKRLTEAAEKAPKDRSRRYDLARYCIQHRQYRAALSILKEAESAFGPDSTIRQMRADIADGMTKAGLNPAVAQPGAGNGP